MSELERILSEQRECAEYLMGDGMDKAGARLGLADWTAEEMLADGEYETFLKRKQFKAVPTGFEVLRRSLNPMLFDFQRDIVHWAVKRGRAGLFADCGLGKTPMQLDWARIVAKHTDKPILILAPLAVSQQTKREGEKFGIEVHVCAEEKFIQAGQNITNYEKLAHFPDASLYGGLVLDESSILKGFDGKTRKALTEWAAVIPFRLACTATPAPNDYMELGNHAEFLGVMTCVEMLSMFFVHDGGDTSKWRLKRHAEDVFWKWVASWAVAIRRPSDLGYDDADFILPSLDMHQVTVSVEEAPEGFLFPVEGNTLQERNEARRDSITDRVAACGDIIGSHDKLAVCGNQNMPRSVASATEPTPPCGNEDASRRDLPKTTKPICVRTTQQTKSDSKNIDLQTLNADDCGKETDMRPMRNTERHEKQTPEEEIHSRNAPTESNPSSGSLQSSTRQWSKSNAGNAPYAETSVVTIGLADCTSITATQRAESDRCYVERATSDWENSKMTQGFCEKPPSTSWVIWCNLNSEQDALEKEFAGKCVSVRGSDSSEWKIEAERRWRCGEVPIMLSKPLIFGYGMNWAHCSHVAFVGLSDSYEQFYQAVRRSWRFGQKRVVHCYVITAETEGAVVRNIERKEKQASEMMEGMVAHMKAEMQKNVHGQERDSADYETDMERSDRWTAILGDCVDKTRELASDSIDYSIFSPPFASLYTYSNSERDMGNSKDYAEFEAHFRFLVSELYRVIKPGRLLSFHCMNLPISKEREGFIGIRDFRGELIRMFIDAGWIFHSEVVIWKDPVTAMQRTKALGLLYKQLRKDSCMSRQGIPDYLVTMRKPGVNPDPVTKTHEGFPVDRWQRYASPVWMDIDPSDTLTRTEARDDADERHICALQLQVIERAIELWTNPEDLVLSPFMGIGSEGHQAIKQGRRFVGIELKKSYWKQACLNLRFAESQHQSPLDFSSGFGQDQEIAESMG